MKDTTDTKITAAMIKKLRDETGVAMMDCKKILLLKKGNYEEALNYITKPEEVEVFCSRCDKAIGTETIYHRTFRGVADCRRLPRYCEECQSIIDKEIKEQDKIRKKKEAEEKRAFKLKMTNHRKEMKELKKTNPVGYMSVFYAVCRDCMVVTKCNGCTLKFCAVCNRNKHTCSQCKQTKDKSTVEFLRKTLEDYSKLFVKVNNETVK